MKASELNVDVRDSVFQPGAAEGPILYDRSLEKARYKVWLYLDGDDLPYVKSATYTLHPSFPDPVRTVTRSAANPTCALEIWTWGLFNVRVEIEDKSGGRHYRDHELSYARHLTQEAEYRQVHLG